MAQRAYNRAPRQIRRQTGRTANLQTGGYFLVHSDQLYSLEPVDEPMTYESSPRPLGPMSPEVCDPEPTPRSAGYGPNSLNTASARPTGFFLDRYVY